MAESELTTDSSGTQDKFHELARKKIKKSVQSVLWALPAHTASVVKNLRRVALTTPIPRDHPLLADIFKRIGLVERTGRGVDRIYIGQLRNGRPILDYTRSTETNVTVALDSKPADLNLVLLAIRVNQRLGHNLRVEDLLALWEMWQHHTTTPATLSFLLQRNVVYASRTLEHLREHGITQLTNATDYSLAPDLRTAAPTPLEPQSAILAHMQAQGRITRREIVALLKANNLSQQRKGKVI